MNRKNLNQIFDAYIQQFEVLNDSRNVERHRRLPEGVRSIRF